MKTLKKFFIFLFLNIYLLSYSQERLNLNLISNFSYEQEIFDIWGYTFEQQIDSTIIKREFALVGAQNGISIVEITNPETPIEIAFFNGVISTHRDIKTWQNFLYCVNETSSGLQIVDLNEAISGNIDIAYSENVDLNFNEAHNLFIDENGFLYVFGPNYPTIPDGCQIYDLNIDPMNPIFKGSIDEFYIHDGMVRGDTLWAAGIYAGFFAVIDVSDKTNPNILATQSTPSNKAHNCWLSDDGNYLFTTDEVDGGYIASFDVSDINNIEEIDRVQSWSNMTNVMPHNTFVDGNFLVSSYYKDGIMIHDISQPSNIIEVGYFDTSLLSGGGSEGAWGVFPYFSSGNIVVSDIQSGLFILERKFNNASLINGIISDGITNQPLSQVQVEIVGSNDIVLSDFNGIYQTGIHDDGIYLINFSLDGYTSLSESVNLINGQIYMQNVQLFPVEVNVNLIKNINDNFQAKFYSNIVEIYLSYPQNIQIFNNSGKIVFKNEFSNGKFLIDLNHFNNGVYFITNSKFNKIVKWIKI